MHYMKRGPGRTLGRAATVSFVLAVVSAAAAVAGPFGAKYGLWHFTYAFRVLRYAAYGALFASVFNIIIIGLITLTRSRGGRGPAVAVAGLLIAGSAFGLPLYWLARSQSAPPIHEITTDTENPPRFIVILGLREGSPNAAPYGGERVAALQKRTYPEVKPLIIDLPPDAAFETALLAARNMGWRLVDGDVSEGRIEAVDETFFFGFKDDVVVRITPEDGGSRVDVRSKSRVGRSDLGTNAARVKRYLGMLDRLAGERKG